MRWKIWVKSDDNGANSLRIYEHNPLIKHSLENFK